MKKLLAMGQDIDAGNFGVEPIAAHSRGKHADAKGSTHKRVLKPAQRSAPPPVNVGGKYPAQANPDHGPHDGY